MVHCYWARPSPVAMNGPRITEGAIVNTRIGSQMLLMPWGDPLLSAIRRQVQVSTEFQKLTNLLGILDKGGDHMEKDGKVII